MEFLYLSNPADRKKALNYCKVLIEKCTLIPVIGTGFSSGTSTDNGGIIPTVEEFKNTLLAFVTDYSGYSEEELRVIKEESLSELAGEFWRIYNRIPPKSLDPFYAYFERNFQNISCRKAFQDSFLSIHWPYLFTLNYDSLIEDSSKRYYAIIPYDKINRHYLKDRIRLYKIHGDAKKFVSTSDNRYLTISVDQYVESMLDDTNEDMRNELLTTFTSKSILFFGCSLSGELDLLFSSQLALKDKVRHIDPVHQLIIYISFESGSSEDIPFSTRKQDILAQYGITHVFRVFSEQQSNLFFSDLAQLTKNITKPGISNFLAQYSSIRFNYLKSDDVVCRDYLFQENLIWQDFNSHTVTIPGYTVKRTILQKIINSISSGDPLCFISGNFYSGKSFVLLQTANHFTSKKVYIFPSGINLTDDQLDNLLSQENTLFCFDSKTLTVGQIKILSIEHSLDKIAAHHSTVLVVIDAFDEPIYRYIFESRNISRKFQQFRVSGTFDDQEDSDFNKNIGLISLPPYNPDKKNETLLDYIVKNEKELVGSSSIENFFLEPQSDLLAHSVKNRIKALIMLATEIRIPAKRAIQFGIDNAISEMIQICHDATGVSVIEKDYSMYAGDSSGFEFVCNSKYWIIHTLSIFAKSQKNSIDVIANAYLSIIYDYRRLNKNNDLLFYQNSQPYYFFDHIQVLFNHRWFSNSSKLVNEIYKKLLPVLSDSFQFLHQKAKGILVIAQAQIKNRHYNESKQNLKEALFNISRAIKLAQLYPNARNIEETILHMTYTKGRILIAFSCIALDRIPQAVETCYELYQLQQNIQNDAFDFVTGNSYEQHVFRKFKYRLLSDKRIQYFSDLDMKKTEYLLSRWTGKTIKMKKR